MEPKSLEEACRILEERGSEAEVLAGGTDLLRNIHDGCEKPEVVLSIAHLDELSGMREKDCGLTIGCLTTMAEMARHESIRSKWPALAEAAGRMGSPQVRNRATIGGNFCNASPCADSVPPTLVHDGVMRLFKGSESRMVSASAFITGPGETTLKEGEILGDISLPKPPPCTGSAFIKLGKRKACEITIASAAARLTLGEDGVVVTARIALGSVGPTPLRAFTAEKILEGREPTDETFSEAAEAASKDACPIDDLRASADYRTWMVEVLTRRVLQTALERANGREGLS